MIEDGDDALEDPGGARVLGVPEEEAADAAEIAAAAALAHVGGEQEEEQPGDLGGEAGEGVGIAERGEQAVGGVRALDPVPADGEDEAVELALELGDALAVEAEDGAALSRRQSIEQGDPGGVEARLVLKDRVELVEGERLGLLGELLGELLQLGGAADQIGALGDGGA